MKKKEEAGNAFWATIRLSPDNNRFFSPHWLLIQGELPFTEVSPYDSLFQPNAADKDTTTRMMKTRSKRGRKNTKFSSPFLPHEQEEKERVEITFVVFLRPVLFFLFLWNNQQWKLSLPTSTKKKHALCVCVFRCVPVGLNCVSSAKKWSEISKEKSNNRLLWRQGLASSSHAGLTLQEFGCFFFSSSSSSSRSRLFGFVPGNLARWLQGKKKEKKKNTEGRKSKSKVYV